MADQAVEHRGFASALKLTKITIKLWNKLEKRWIEGLETYDIAEGNDIEESGGAFARGGVFIDVLVGENGGGLKHGFWELDELLHGLHGSLSEENGDLLMLDLDLIEMREEILNAKLRVNLRMMMTWQREERV